MRKALVTTAIALINVFLNVQLLPAQQPQTIDIGRAQVQMLNRIEEAVKAYGRSIDISENWIGYCQQELYLKTYAHPQNGYSHFGINYNSITDRKRLDEILSARQNYETSSIILCLANAKKTLADARK